MLKHLTIAVLISAAGISPCLAAQVDANLFTIYDPTIPGQLDFLVCGSLPGSNGCYGSGTLSGFKRACAFLEGVPVYRTVESNRVVTRDVFVLDGGVASSDPVTLYIFKIVQSINGSRDTVSSAFVKSIPLPPLNGGSSASCAMAATPNVIFAGTNLSFQAARIVKTSLVTGVGGSHPPIPLASITTDASGFVTVTFAGNGVSGFEVFDKKGNGVESGGGGYSTTNTKSGTPIPPP
ncbi:MAG TPA: hypothetical protein VG798_06675 [Rhizomicrobium sp.]|nr:hypothetical protein [Rhizomicrobium sp.]